MLALRVTFQVCDVPWALYSSRSQLFHSSALGFLLFSVLVGLVCFFCLVCSSKSKFREISVCMDVAGVDCHDAEFLKWLLFTFVQLLIFSGTVFTI